MFMQINISYIKSIYKIHCAPSIDDIVNRRRICRYKDFGSTLNEINHKYSKVVKIQHEENKNLTTFCILILQSTV